MPQSCYSVTVLAVLTRVECLLVSQSASCFFMDDPASPVSGRRSTWRRLRRAASNGSAQARQERQQTAETVDERSPRVWKRLRKAPSSGGRSSAGVAEERKEEIVLDQDDDEEDVPLMPRRPSARPASRSLRPASSVSSPPSLVTLSDSSDSEDESSCSICLGQPADAAVLDSCAHSFCFLCIFRWCTDICNNCPLCKRRVTQIKHYGEQVSTESKSSGGSRQAERATGQPVVKQERRSEEEERRLEEEEADGAADDWALIQTQRAENQMKQAARRRGRRQGGGPLSQLSLESSPTSLAEGIEAITAIGQSESIPLTRQMAKQRVAEQQHIIGRTQSNDSARPSSLHSLRASQSNATPATASPTASSPVSISTITPPISAPSLSRKASPADMLVVHIPDRQQRASYEDAEEEEVPSPSILNVACEICFTDENEHLLLLCDGCDDAYHTYCLQPRLDCIPENEWFCPNCLYEARLQASDEQKDVSNAATPRRNRSRAQRLGMHVSPAIRQRLTETPQSADMADEDYTPSGGTTRFDSTPVPLSFASFRPGHRAVHRRRSVRQEQLRRQAIESQRQKLDEQIRLRAERAAKRREDRARPSNNEDESDDDNARSSASPIAVSSPTSSRYATSADTAPLSSLHQLSSSQTETLQQRMLDLEMDRVRKRDVRREEVADEMAKDDFVENLLDRVAHERNAEKGGSSQHEWKRTKRKRKLQQAERAEEEDWSGDSGRVRRKAVNKSKPRTEPIIVSTSAPRLQADSFSASFFPSRPAPVQPSDTATLTSSASTAGRPSSLSGSSTSLPSSSLSSLPYPIHSPQLSATGHLSSATTAARTTNVERSPTLASNVPSVVPSHAVVPPARFPYTAPVILKRLPVSSPPPSSSPHSSSPAASSSWASPSPTPVLSVSSPSPSVPPVQTFDEFQHTRSSPTTRSPFRASYSPQQQRQHKRTAAAGDKLHSINVKATLPMRRPIVNVAAAK